MIRSDYMALTRIDYAFGQGEPRGELSAVNPNGLPGSLLMAGASGGSSSIKAEVALRLALQRFTNTALDLFSGELERSSDSNLELIESSFREANRAVFKFANRRDREWFNSSLAAVLIDGSSACAGRIGRGSVYLYRGGELFSFFAINPVPTESTPRGFFLGSDRLVSVDLASVPMRESDLIVLLSEPIDPVQEGELSLFLQGLSAGSEDLAVKVVEGLVRRNGNLAFCQAASIGPDVIYLKKAV